MPVVEENILNVINYLDKKANEKFLSVEEIKAIFEENDESDEIEYMVQEGWI